jgi:hypothetical protein
MVAPQLCEFHSAHPCNAVNLFDGQRYRSLGGSSRISRIMEMVIHSDERGKHFSRTFVEFLLMTVLTKQAFAASPKDVFGFQQQWQISTATPGTETREIIVCEVDGCIVCWTYWLGTVGRRTYRRWYGVTLEDDQRTWW